MTHNSKTSISKLFGFMQITTVTHNCRLGRQAEFILGLDDSKNNQNVYTFSIEHM